MAERKKLTAAELVEQFCLNEGWEVTGGEAIGKYLPYQKRLVIDIWDDFGEDLVLIDLPDKIVEVPADNIVMAEPWLIQILQPVTRLEARKQKEGGGTHEVTRLVAAVRLRNPTLQKKLAKKGGKDEIN